MRRAAKLLSALYTFTALSLYLYTYPLTGNSVIDALTSIVVAWAAAFTAYSVPRYSSILFALALLASTTSIIAGSAPPATMLLTSNPLAATTYMALIAANIALLASIHRLIGVLAASTGALAGTTLHAPYGHLAALALLSTYAALSASPSRTLIALLYVLATWYALILRAVALEAKTGFTDLHTLDTRPSKPVIEALLSQPTSKPTPEMIRLFQGALSYVLEFTVALVALYILSSMLSKYIEESATRYMFEFRAEPRIALLALSGLSAFTFILCVDVGYALALINSLEANAPYLQVALFAIATSVVTGLWRIASVLISMPSAEEERRAILDAVREIREELESVRKNCGSILPFALLERINSLLNDAERLQKLAEKAGPLTLSKVASILGSLKQDYARVSAEARRALEETARESISACTRLEEWGAQNGYPVSCDKSVVDKLERAHSISLACKYTLEAIATLEAVAKLLYSDIVEDVGEDEELKEALTLLLTTHNLEAAVRFTVIASRLLRERVKR